MKEQIESEKLKEWYVIFIKTLREEYAKLSAEEIWYISKKNDYHSKCQIEVFWLKQPEWQLIIKTHFEDRPDGEIIINGPYDSTVFPDEIKKIVNEQRWNRKLYNEESKFLPPGSPRLYSELLAQHLHRFVEKAKNAFFIKWYVTRGLSDTIIRGDGVTIEHYHGNMSVDRNYKILIEEIILETKKRAEYGSKSHNQQEISDSLTEETFNGFGAYFFPPMVIGPIQRPSPSDILEGRTNIGFSTFDKKSFDVKFLQTPVIITKDGFVGVCDKNKENSLKILNTIMVVSTLEGLDAFAVREHELSRIDCNLQTLNITGYNYDLSTVRNQLFRDDHGEKILEHWIKEIPEDKIKNILQKASEIFKNEQVSDELRILLESLTHLHDSEFSQSFFMSWLIIERYVSDIYHGKHKKLDNSSEKYSEYPSVDHMLRKLKLENVLSQQEYDVYLTLKERRNEFAHSGKSLEKEEAEKCMNIAKEIILKKVS